MLCQSALTGTPVCVPYGDSGVWEGNVGWQELGGLSYSPGSITGYRLSLGLSLSIRQMREWVWTVFESGPSGF